MIPIIGDGGPRWRARSRILSPAIKLAKRCSLSPVVTINSPSWLIRAEYRKKTRAPSHHLPSASRSWPRGVTNQCPSLSTAKPSSCNRALWVVGIVWPSGREICRSASNCSRVRGELRTAILLIWHRPSNTPTPAERSADCSANARRSCPT